MRRQKPAKVPQVGLHCVGTAVTAVLSFACSCTYCTYMAEVGATVKFSSLAAGTRSSQSLRECWLQRRRTECSHGEVNRRMQQGTKAISDGAAKSPADGPVDAAGACENHQHDHASDHNVGPSNVRILFTTGKAAPQAPVATPMRSTPAMGKSPPAPCRLLTP